MTGMPVTLRLLRGASAPARYVVSCAALAVLVAAFAITAARTALSTAPPAAPTTPLLGPGALDFSSAVRDLGPPDSAPSAARPSWTARLERWSAAAVPLWVAGVMLLSVRVSVGCRLAFAAALADLEALRQQPALTLAATDGPLLRRVRRLVASPDPVGPSVWPALLLPLAIAIVIGGVAVASAQQAPEQVRVPGMGRTIPGDRGIIEGQVVEAGSGRAIAGARVELRGPDPMDVTTDQTGHYETGPLAPGSYAISVTAPGHAPAFYDGRAGSISAQSSVDGSLTVSGRAAGPPRITLTGNVEISASTRVDVGAGSLLSNIDVAMRATGRLSGRIFDDRGRALADAYVQLVATRTSAVGTVPRVAFARSDADGTYRMEAAPGDYTVRAYVGRAVRPSRDATLAYLAIFFPGVRTQEEAQVIRIGAGVEQYDVDFALLSTRTVRVSGTASRLDHSRDSARWRRCLRPSPGAHARRSRAGGRDQRPSRVSQRRGDGSAGRAAWRLRRGALPTGRNALAFRLAIHPTDALSQNGHFELPLLPPGDYLAVATAGVPFLMIGDPVPTLRGLQSIGTRLKVGDGEHKTIAIRASPAP